MAYSYAQLASEAAWRDEIVPPALASMGRTVRTALGLPAEAIGFKGNNLHLNGGHRSRRWILTSEFCTDRTYTVTYAADRLGDENWISAFDISAPPDILLPMCQRLDEAVRAGELEELAAWYGNLDGDRRVDGYNNILNRVASSDSSHLTHLHGTVLRRYANDAGFMSRLAAVLTGSRELESMLFKIAGKPEIYVPRGDGYVHLTSGPALTAAQAAGYRIVEVPSLADLEALLGKPYTPANPVMLTDADRADIATRILAGLPTAAQIAAATGSLEAAADRARADVLDGP